MNQLIKRIEVWMESFYNYSSNNPESELYDDFVQLKNILNNAKKRLKK